MGDLRRIQAAGVMGVLLSLVLSVPGTAHAAPAGRPAASPPDFSTCKDVPFTVDLSRSIGALPEDAGERREQLRDWTWTTLVGRIAARRAEPQLIAATSRLPLLRDESLSHLLEEPTGPARAVSGKDGTLYVLVDRSEPTADRATVLEAIDQEAYLLGHWPAAAVIYGARLDSSRATAEVCELGVVGTSWMESPAQGYRHATVTSPDHLMSFLSGGVDLLSARFTTTGGAPALVVTGRARGARTARAPMTPEHVAAVAQPLRYVPSGDLASSSSQLPEKARESLQQLADELDQAMAAGGEMVAPDPETQYVADTVVAWKKQHPQVSTSELLLSVSLQLREGFSLDPYLDVPAASKLLAELAAVTVGSALEPTRTAFVSLGRRLEGANVRTAQDLLAPQKRESDPYATELLEGVSAESRVNCARYEGAVKGTKVAMTLFYTDLLAKLLTLDYQHLTQRSSVPGFVSVPAFVSSDLHCASDVGTRYTRIWFAKRDEAFRRDQPGSLRFSPIAVRLHARGSASEGGKEVDPTAEMLRFIRWWDRNYVAVAQREPQYELLNQIIKWALVRRLADATGNAAQLAFLAQIPVDRSIGFSSWLAQQPDLLWHGPVTTVAMAHLGTECVPSFRSEGFSQCGGSVLLSGGVDLPDMADVTDKPTRRSTAPPFLTHLGGEAEPQANKRGEFRYRSIPADRGHVDAVKLRVQPGEVKYEAVLHSDMPERGEAFDRLPLAASRHFELHTKLVGRQRLEIEERHDRFGAAKLTSEDLLSATVRVTVEQRAEATAKAWASSTKEEMRQGGLGLGDAAKAVAGRSAVLRRPDGSVALRVNPEGEPQGIYAVMSSGGGNHGPPPVFRVGAADPYREGPSGEGLGSGDGALFVWLERDDRQGSRPLAGATPIESRPGVHAVRQLLDANDLDGASRKAREKGAPVEAIAEVAEATIRQGRFDLAAALVNELPWDGRARVELRRLLRAVSECRADDETVSEVDRQRLDDLGTQLALASSRLSPEDANRWLASAGDMPGPRLVPEGFSETRLPAASHPPGEALAENERLVTEVISLVETSKSLPRQLTVGDRKLVLQGESPSPGPEGAGGFLPVVVPCRVDGDPEMHDLKRTLYAFAQASLADETVSAEDRQQIAQLIEEVSDAADNGGEAGGPGSIWPPSCYRSAGPDPKETATLEIWRHMAAVSICADRDQEAESSEDLKDCVAGVLAGGGAPAAAHASGR